jgi:hypothetical protein
VQDTPASYIDGFLPIDTCVQPIHLNRAIFQWECFSHWKTLTDSIPVTGKLISANETMNKTLLLLT